MTESEEIMRVHPYIIKDEQWKLASPSLKASHAMMSLATDDDSMTVASLNNKVGRKDCLSNIAHYLAAGGTHSDKQYLRQYNQIPDGAQPPTT